MVVNIDKFLDSTEHGNLNHAGITGVPAEQYLLSFSADVSDNAHFFFVGPDSGQQPSGPSSSVLTRHYLPSAGRLVRVAWNFQAGAGSGSMGIQIHVNGSQVGSSLTGASFFTTLTGAANLPSPVVLAAGDYLEIVSEAFPTSDFSVLWFTVEP